MSYVQTLKVLSFDPGTTVTGWAVSTYTRSSHILTVSKCGEITPIRDAKKLNKDECIKYNQQLIALDHLYNSVYDLITKNKPDCVVTEDAFLHPKFIMAYAALNLCIHTISRAARVHGLICEKIAPKLVKKLVSEDGTSNKNSMFDAVTNNPYIIMNNNKCAETIKLSEHVIDAIGVGYAYTRQI